MSHDQIQTCPGSCSPFDTPICEWLCFFLLASSHHLCDMNFYIFLLLLVILSAYSEIPEHDKPPDSLDFNVVAVCPNSSSDPLGILAPVLPQGEMFGPVLPQNIVLPQNEVYRTVLPYMGSVLQNGVFKFVLPQNGVFEVVLPQNGVFTIVPSQPEVNKTVSPQNEMFSDVIVNSDRVKNTVNSLLNIGDKIMEFLTSTMLHGVEKLAWMI